MAVFLNEGAGTAGSERVRRTIDLARAALDADLHVTATRDPAELATWLLCSRVGRRFSAE